MALWRAEIYRMWFFVHGWNKEIKLEFHWIEKYREKSLSKPENKNMQNNFVFSYTHDENA